MRVGLISDTHGRLRPEVFDRFRGVERILHAGDVGPAELLERLGTLAPVTAVWGNTDGPELRARLPELARLELHGCSILVVHGHQFGVPAPAGLRAAHPDADLIVFGHTHRPVVDRTTTQLVVNPGAAGPARFGLPPSVAVLLLAAGTADVQIHEL